VIEHVDQREHDEGTQFELREILIGCFVIDIASP
jgi:hypothetical protein